MARKIEAMYKLFGRYTGKQSKQCKDCCNFIRKEYNRTYFKCLVYGDTDSEATDWRASYEACGMFNNKNYIGYKIINLLKRGPRPKDNTPIDGQLTLFESR